MKKIEAVSLRKIYKMGKVEVKALEDVSFSVEEGELVSIIGPSGSGKSTLLHILGCLDQPTSGIYRLDEEEINQKRRGELVKIRRHKIGFVFQMFNLLPRTSAFKNVMLPLIYSGAKRKEQKEKALAAIKTVGLMNRIKHKPNELSGGEQQRVAIARAIINYPSIILADEPTGNLDSKTGREIISLLKELNQKGATIIMVTHEEEIARQAGRIIRLKDGRVVN